MAVCCVMVALLQRRWIGRSFRHGEVRGDSEREVV